MAALHIGEISNLSTLALKAAIANLIAENSPEIFSEKLSSVHVPLLIESIFSLDPIYETNIKNNNNNSSHNLKHLSSWKIMKIIQPKYIKEITSVDFYNFEIDDLVVDHVTMNCVVLEILNLSGQKNITTTSILSCARYDNNNDIIIIIIIIRSPAPLNTLYLLGCTQFLNQSREFPVASGHVLQVWL